MPHMSEEIPRLVGVSARIENRAAPEDRQSHLAWACRMSNGYPRFSGLAQKRLGQSPLRFSGDRALVGLEGQLGCPLPCEIRGNVPGKVLPSLFFGQGRLSSIRDGLANGRRVVRTAIKRTVTEVFELRGGVAHHHRAFRNRRL